MRRMIILIAALAAVCLATGPALAYNTQTIAGVINVDIQPYVYFDVIRTSDGTCVDGDSVMPGHATRLVIEDPAWFLRKTSYSYRIEVYTLGEEWKRTDICTAHYTMINMYTTGPGVISCKLDSSTCKGVAGTAWLGDEGYVTLTVSNSD